jgi:CheY-like chemotaxis protein
MMLTSGSHADDVVRCRELAIDAYLTKPVSQGELKSAIFKVLASRGSEIRTIAVPNGHGPASNGRRAPDESLRILLVEDNIVNQQVASSMLVKAGHTVTIVSNGREALTALDREAFDLILMDVQMPIMDGLEATAAIRARERFTGSRLPIIGLTAHAMNGDRERCLNAGMDEYLAKPMHIRELRGAISRLRCFAQPEGCAAEI